MTHSTYTPQERASHPVSDGLVRLSIDLEDTADILSDLEQAFSPKSMALAGESHVGITLTPLPQDLP